MDKIDDYKEKVNGFYRNLEKRYDTLPPEIKAKLTMRNLIILGSVMVCLMGLSLMKSKPAKVFPRRPELNIDFQQLPEEYETINSVYIPLKVPLTNLRRHLNSKAPTYIPISEEIVPPNIPDTPLPNETRMSFLGDVELGNILLAPGMNGFQTTVPVKGEFKSLINYELDIGIPGLNASDRLQSFFYKGDLHINSYPTVSYDWGLEPNIRAGITFSEAFFDFEPILDMRKEATLFADVIIKKELAKVEQQILNSYNFRKGLQPMWNLLSYPYFLSKKNRTYITFEPSKIYYENSETENGVINLGVRLVYLCRTHANIKPLPIPSKKIPTMIDSLNEKDVFDLKVPFTIHYKDLNYNLTKKHYMENYENNLNLSDHSINNAKFSIKEVEVFGDANFAYFKVGFKTENVKGKKAEGRLFFRATPVLNDGIIRFQNIKYTKETRYALTKSAKWLLNDEIYKFIESFSSYDMSEDVYLLENDLNTRLATIGVKEDIGISFRGKVKVKDVVDITLQDGCFSLIANASGELKADTDYLKANMGYDDVDEDE